MKNPIHKTAFLLVLALAAPLSAGEKIKLKSGKVVEGTATSYDAQKQELHFRLVDGKEMVYPLDQLDARSVYLVHTSVVKKDSGTGQLQLANFARDAGLYEHAARRYGYAEKADPSLKLEIDKERAKLRKMAADFCLRNARDAKARNDEKEAEKWLSILLERLPDEPQSAEASTLLEASYVKTRNSEQEKLSAQFKAALEKDAAKGKQTYERMVENTQKGLTARNASQSEKLWKSALKDGDTVLSEIQKLQKKYADDAEVQAGCAKYQQLTSNQMLEANLHLASQALVKSSLKEAQSYCNAALAVDPKSAEALAMRARIEQASNEGLFGWW